MLAACCFAAASSAAWAAPLQILTFQKAQLSPSEQHQLCEQIKALCRQPEQWRSLKTADQSLWLLSGGDVARFHASAAGFQLARQWHLDISNQAQGASNGQFIFPKLFPMAQNRYAVAVIESFSEMYSGGGAGIERASFYELKDAGNAHQFIQNYPFSLNRMIRACFSEQDYASAKGDCHDEDRLSLDIRPVQPMLWQFRYRYNLSVSPASDSGGKSYQGSRNLNIDLNRAPAQPDIPAAWNYAGME